MNISNMQIDEKYLHILEQEMYLKFAQAKGAEQAYKIAKLNFCKTNYRFKKGQKITVNYTDGAIDYIFEKIDWCFSRDRNPVIYAQEILKSGKLSNRKAEALRSSKGEISWDAMWVVPALEKESK